MEVSEERRLQEELRPSCAKDPTPRRRIVSRLIHVQRTKSLKLQTLYLSVHLLDRLLAQRRLQRSRDSLELLITILIRIASDRNEDARFRLEHIWLGNKTWYKREEEQVLAILDHQLGWPGPLTFLDQYVASTVCSKSNVSMLRELATFLLDVSLLNNSMASQLPSAVAAAVYFVAVTMLEGAPWTQKMELVTKHSFLEIYPIVQSLCCSYEEDCRFVVALGKNMQQMADFVMIKLAKGFVVSLAITDVSAASKEEMQQQLTLDRL